MVRDKKQAKTLRVEGGGHYSIPTAVTHSLQWQVGGGAALNPSEHICVRGSTSDKTDNVLLTNTLTHARFCTFPQSPLNVTSSEEIFQLKELSVCFTSNETAVMPFFPLE